VPKRLLIPFGSRLRTRCLFGGGQSPASILSLDEA
jgi:hypothetical protein